MGKIPQKCDIFFKYLEKLTCNSESDCVSASPLIAWMSSAVDWARIRACRTISPESKLAMSSPLATKICSMMSGILSVWPSLTWLRRSLRALKQKLLREFYKNFDFFFAILTKFVKFFKIFKILKKKVFCMKNPNFANRKSNICSKNPTFLTLFKKVLQIPNEK